MWSLPIAPEPVRSYAGLMSLASRLFAREIDAALYRQLSESDAFTADGQRFLVEARHVERPEAEVLEELAAEFCRLFIGPQPVCPPYATAHLGEVKLGGRSALRIEEFMEGVGLHVVIGEADAVLDHDHLSVELALLAHLYLIAVDTAGDPRARAEAWEVSRELLHQHVWPWADGYLRQLESAAEMAPYNVVACLVRSALEQASQWPTHEIRTAAGDRETVSA